MITLTQDIYISGVKNTSGTSLTLDAGIEGDLVTRKCAIYTTDPMAGNPTPASLITDASGNTVLVGGDGAAITIASGNGSRPRFLVYGNSLAGQSSVSQVGATTTLSVASLAGATTVTVAAIGSISSGNKIAIGLYDGTVHTTTVNGAPAGSVITLSAPLPRMARLGATLQTYTTVGVSNIRRGGGPVYQALAMLGMPCELVQGYGYGNGTVLEILADLPRVLQSIRPKYVHFIDVENSLGTTSARLIQTIKAKIEIALSYGAIPLVNTAYPSSNYTAGAVVANYDAYNAYILGQMANDYPFAIAINVGPQWIDPEQPTLRTPLSGWTDGIHPNTNKSATIGSYFYDEFLPILPSAKSLANYVLTENALMSGSGGTATGMQGGSVVPASWTYTADAGVTATSSTNSDGESNIAMAVPGTSNVSTTTLQLSQRYTLPANAAADNQALLAYIKLKINAMTGITLAFAYIVFSGGESYSSCQDADAATDPGLIGKTLQLESPIVKIPTGSTWVEVRYWVRPTSGLSNGVNVDIDLIEGGIVPASYITH